MEVRMMLKTGASVAVLILMLGVTAAVGQTSPPAQRPAPTTPPVATEAPKAPVPGQILVQDANTVLAKDFIGQTVYDPDKVKIGSISDLLLSKDAKTVEGFVIGVGGFLRIGEKSVALKMDRLKMMAGPDGAMQLTMDVKKEELTNTPTFKSKKDQDAEKQATERVRTRPETVPLPKN
jgi:sporulation protein YlmC with PRC-barrel domain